MARPEISNIPRRTRWRAQPFLLMALAVVAVTLRPGSAWTQVTTSITSSGLGTVVTGSGTVDITGGTRRGANLFHSFGLFNVGAFDTANFLNDSGLATSNILGRVTGGQPSNIYGTIRTTDFGSANLFLLNPFGWIFGPTASLDVGGSFHVSTADYIRLSDTRLFNAVPGADDALLTSAPPAAFGFLGPRASITVDGSFLQVPSGQTLSLIGGDVQIAGGATLLAPEGRVQIASVASEGTVTTANLNVSDASQLGTINITGSFINTSSDFSGTGAGGAIVIRGGELLVEGSVIQSNTVGDVDGAPIIIEATGNADFTNGTVIETVTSGLGRGGDIQINGHDIRLIGSVIGTRTEFGGGVGGDISITANDGSVTLSSSTVLSQTTFSGNGGSINISSGSLTIANGSALLSEVPGGDGRGGDIIVDATDLNIGGGSTVTTSTFGSTSGRGGDIELIGDGSAFVSGSGTSIFSASFGEGRPGDISATFKALSVTDGAVIQAGAFAGTEAGNSVSITATDSILISNGAGISTQASFGEVGPLTISVPTGSLTVDNGFIATSTVGPGTAGELAMNVGSLTLTRGGQIISSSIDVSSGSAEVGIGGDITINANSISISGKSPTGASVLPSPFSDFFTDPHSGVFSTANGTGAAGNISMNTGQLTVANGGTISTESSGTAAGISAGLPGNSGNIDLVVETLRMDGGTITTAAAEAAGGDITITHTGSLLHLTNSQITTSVNGGLGGGGNIAIGAEIDSSGNVFNINPFDFIVLNNSGIHANAFGGPGGNINIFTDLLLSSVPLATAITASSALNTPGIIDIQATVTEFSSDISQLPDVPLQATELLRATCAARVAGGRSSSLVLAGRGGLPLEPGSLLPSPLYLGADSAISFDNQNQPGERPKFSPSNFSILSDNQRSPRMGWNQFQLAKTTLGLDCSR